MWAEQFCSALFMQNEENEKSACNVTAKMIRLYGVEIQ